MSTATATSTEIHLDICTPEGKTWLARITGVGGKYGLDRDFVRAVERDTSRSGRTGTTTYLVTDGVYEANEGRRKLGRSYWIVRDGAARKVSRDEAVAAL